MPNNTFPIDEHNLARVRDHIRREFAEKSWWPAEGPLKAKDEFERAQANPEALAEWCARWLGGSQWRDLRRAVQKEASSSPRAQG